MNFRFRDEEPDDQVAKRVPEVGANKTTPESIVSGEDTWGAEDGDHDVILDTEDGSGSAHIGSEVRGHSDGEDELPHGKDVVEEDSGLDDVQEDGCVKHAGDELDGVCSLETGLLVDLLVTLEKSFEDREDLYLDKVDLLLSRVEGLETKDGFLALEGSLVEIEKDFVKALEIAVKNIVAEVVSTGADTTLKVARVEDKLGLEFVKLGQFGGSCKDAVKETKDVARDLRVVKRLLSKIIISLDSMKEVVSGGITNIKEF